MHKTKHPLQVWFRNAPLKIKITLITAFAIFLTSMASLIGSFIFMHSCNNLLYQALAGSLSSSAEEISSKLANIESMTNSIISSQAIRKNLISLLDEPPSDILDQNVDNMITSSLIDYYQNYKSNDINYISLYNPQFTSSSYKAAISELPDTISDTVIQAAGENSGYACWITDYCITYGLFLGRDSRRVQNLKFETLGTVVVNVDLEKLISSSTQSILNNGSAQYILYENGQEIFHSRSLDASQLQTLQKDLHGNYQILTLGGLPYFCTTGKIANNNWDYICLIPYTYIAHTLRLTRYLSFGILLFSILVVFILSRFMIRSVTADFASLVDKMKQFGQDESTLPVSEEAYANRVDEAGILHRQFDQMTVEIQSLIRQNYVNEILTKDARLKALESQINPHFLYNALESVNWRAKAIGATDISEMVQALGDLLRATLSNKNGNFTVRHELHIVNDYITIQKIRFDEERLDYQEEISPDILDAELPQMTIQPLIDNAINYAMEVITETCHIVLTGYAVDGVIHIKVTNNGSQFEEHLLEKLENGSVKSHGIGIGLLNIHQRIQLIYGSDYGLTLYNTDEDHAVAEIIIPQSKV